MWGDGPASRMPLSWGWAHLPFDSADGSWQLARPRSRGNVPGGVRVAKPEWGVKRVCQSCETKFYDLGRSPIACPQCGARFDPEALLKSRLRQLAAPAKPGKP